MTMKKREEPEDTAPVLDESWWNSLLDAANQYQDHEKTGGDHHLENENIEIDWKTMEEYFRNDEVFSVQVIGYNKGGLLVRGENFKGFIPNSHIKEVSKIQSASAKFHALKQCVGKDVQVKVIECDQKMGKLILSERAAENAPGKRLDVFEDLSMGSVVEGEVTNITKFGIFLDLGGIEGLVHVSEISWGKVNHPADIVKIGDRIKASVISVDREKMRIALSMKRLLPNPWVEFNEQYMVGDVITVTINKVVGYGVFAGIEKGIEGLVHITDIQSKDATLTINDLKVGEKIIVTIKAIDVERRRLSMGFISKFE
ncbi:MAG TPA: S1 RNA-binding domain-containing protein [Anaerolineaceae bacterium]|mgnify:CR=1 FL=1|jgi:small subunit ribosomal protein S1|nr:S1 RNA-binding domain-containing protein [Anaerolineaceae bacterium]